MVKVIYVNSNSHLFHTIPIRCFVRYLKFWSLYPVYSLKFCSRTGTGSGCYSKITKSINMLVSVIFRKKYLLNPVKIQKTGKGRKVSRWKYFILTSKFTKSSAKISSNSHSHTYKYYQINIYPFSVMVKAILILFFHLPRNNTIQLSHIRTFMS